MATQAQLDALLEGKRTRHPELREPLSWEGFRQVCEREGVSITVGPLSVDAVLLSALGTSVIVLNCELHPRRHTYRGAHELAHHWLHSEHEPVIYTMRDLGAPDRREDDAEYVATRLLQGW